MTKNFLMILFFVFFNKVHACELTSYNKIIKINKIQDDKVIKGHDCDRKTTQAFKKFISSSNGKLRSSYLKNYFLSEHKITLTIKPQIINVVEIKDLIQERIPNKDIVVNKVTSLIPQSSITLNNSDSIHVDCKDCDNPGEKNIQISINQKKHWLNAEILLKREALVLVKSLNSLREKLTSKHFSKKLILDNGSKPLFTDLKLIQFYQLNKHLKKGDFIKKTDLSPRLLVHYGKKVSLKFKNKSIQLKTMAIAKENGHFGDLIELINQKSNKKIYAKIIDYNKAEIEL